MSDRFCLCGARLDRSSAVQSLQSPCMRMFMSIRTLKSVTSDSKICNICRHSYNKWKNENPEFEIILSRFESDTFGVNAVNDDSVIFFYLAVLTFDFCFFNRILLWTFKLMIHHLVQ